MVSSWSVAATVWERLAPISLWPPSCNRITSPPRIFFATLCSMTVADGAASTEGRTKKIGVLAHGVAESCAAPGEFAANFGVAFEDQQGMSEGVIADGVSGAGDFTGEVWALLGVASDHEKSCLYAVLGENLQQLQGVGIVRAVVVGESDLLCAARETGESCSIPLASGSHGLV